MYYAFMDLSSHIYTTSGMQDIKFCGNPGPHSLICVHVHVIVVSWFLQCMGYVPRTSNGGARGSAHSTRAVLSHAL